MSSTVGSYDFKNFVHVGENKLITYNGHGIFMYFIMSNPFRPCEPPSPNAAPVERPAPVAPYCHCDAHSYSPRVEQYKQLLEKEQKLCQDYERLRKQVGILM